VMTAALTYSNIAPDVMKLVSAPSGAVPVTTTAAAAFAVRMFLGDGVTPVAGLPVTISISAGPGSARLGACPGPMASCSILTDATGLASTTVTPTAFGTITLQAAAVGATQTVTFNAVARSISALQPLEYIAAGAAVAWSPQAAVIQNGAPAAGVAVAWSASAGLTLPASSSLANPSGIAQIAAIAGPLAAGAQATAQACAWTNLCANFSAIGVDPSAWRIVVVNGANQSVSAAAIFAPVVLMVTDGNGNPVAGAPVAIYQTVNTGEMPCPNRGPCPNAPMLAASQAPATSDANGLVSVVPMQLAGFAEVTNLAAATGTQGFAALALLRQP